jgi:hypothetical protein
MDSPEFSFISMPGGYAGLYRASPAIPFEVLLGGDGRPKIFETSILAVRAAKDHLAPKKPVKIDQRQHDILGVKQWLMGKASETAESITIKRAGSFRPFVVERKRKGKRVVQE